MENTNQGKEFAADVLRRRVFLRRMERKLAFKERLYQQHRQKPRQISQNPWIVDKPKMVQ